jgi:hypothetical protein
LEISYYPPGFITPEEFFHRLLLSINRLKEHGKNAPITVLFNSLDQLSSRFPLCAEQKIFVPGLIQMFSAEDITSIFVAAHEGQPNPAEYYGLLSMAELILSLERKPVRRSEWLESISRCLGSPQERIEAVLPEQFHSVCLEVVRFAGGQPAGATGVLELVKDATPFHALCKRSGLFFIPYSENSNASTPEHQTRER